MSSDHVSMSRNRIVGRPRRWLTGLVALGLVVVGCSSSSDGPRDVSADEPAARAIEPVVGCEEGATDIAEIEPGEPPARCETGVPAAAPLDESVAVTIGVSSTSFEQYSVIATALAEGEFERENLDVEVRTAPAADLLSLMTSGDVDVQLTTLGAGQLNAIAQGFDIRWVAGSVRQSEDAQVGYWIRDGLDVCDLAGATIGNPGPLGTGSDVALYQALQDCGVSLRDVRSEVIPFDQVYTALQNGAIDVGGLSDPYWLQAEDDPDLEFLVGTRGEGYPVAGLFFGPRLVDDERDAGAAFVRAYVRTINTYFRDDYKADPEFVEQLSDELDVPADALAAVPSLAFDYELRRGIPDLIQDVVRDATPQAFDDRLPESSVYDLGFLEVVLGHDYGDR